MNSIIKEVSTSYEPETDTRDKLNHMLAVQNKDLIKALDEIEELKYRLLIEQRNNNIISNVNAQLRAQIKNQLDVIGMYEIEINRLEIEK